MPFKDFRQLYDTLAVPPLPVWEQGFFPEPNFAFPDPKDIVAAGGKVEGTYSEFHCVNGVCDGKKQSWNLPDNAPSTNR